MAASHPPIILLLGAAGQLGAELSGVLGAAGRVIALTRAELDLTDVSRIREVVRNAAPAAIVNAAAFTSVDGAEREPALATAVNATAPAVLAEEAERAGAVLVHFSTDYVFDGATRRPYTEADAPNPLSAYAESKWRGEQAVTAAGASHLVFRVSWVYGAHGQNFVRWLLRAARTQRELRMVRDQIGVPTWSWRIATGTTEILQALSDGTRFVLPPDRAGLYHFVSLGETSRFDFAREVLALDPGHTEQRLERLTPISSFEFPSPAHRPPYSVLNSDRLEARFGVRIPEWRADLAQAMARGIAPAP